MKKYLAVFIMILICLHLPMQIRASQSEIGTTVPETHTVSIEAEHASAQYMEGDKGISDAYPVPRFSKPEFKITAKDGYEIKRVLLNDNDVTKNVEKGILKLSEVCENQVIRIETEAVAPEDAEYTETTEYTETAGTAITNAADITGTGKAKYRQKCGTKTGNHRNDRSGTGIRK